jgi:two-component sensor histidine kinase/PAS domain-containing protein
MTKDVSLRAFLGAGAAMLLAVAAREALDWVLPATPPFITLYPAVALAGVLCGPVAAGVSGLLGLIAAIYLWIPPRLSLALPNPTDGVSIILFVIASMIVLAAAALLRSRLNAATVAKDALDLGLAAGGVGTWELNLRTRRIDASSTAHALHGLAADGRETMAEDWLRGVHPADVETARAALGQAVAEGTTAAYSYRIFGPGDGPRWISARGKVVSAGGDRRLLCALVDITEQVRVQEDLARERERLRLALAAGELAVWDYDPATREATIDTQYAVTMGFDATAGTVSRAQIGALIHPEDRPRVVAEHEAQMARGGAYHIEYRIVPPSGGIRWLASHGILMPGDEAAAPPRMIGIIQDITERKRRETSLRELAAARELLVREADHRIKNSLQLVISLLNVQLRGITDPAAVEALRGAASRVGAIAASHLALQGSADLTTIDLAVSLQDLCAHFAALHPTVKIVCQAAVCQAAECQGRALLLDADRAIPLGLVVSEVLTNALRHAFRGRETGTVVVNAMIERAQLMVRISDDGVGMAPAMRRSGLGSRIINALAAQLAATIQMESPLEGGTVVTLRLPLAPADPPQRAADLMD